MPPQWSEPWLRMFETSPRLESCPGTGPAALLPNLLLLRAQFLGRLLTRLPVHPALHATDHEYDVVAEGGVLLHLRHPDAPSKDVVDEGVDKLVGQRFPGQMLHGLQAVVHEHLRCHHHEATNLGGDRQGQHKPRVPTPEFLMHQPIHAEREHHRQQHQHQLSHAPALILVDVLHFLQARFHAGLADPTGVGEASLPTEGRQLP
mmetsp:Transcript_49849/g.126736  ORF Transcript_49849/g.126736 Transcript_49849/m.126736 type:complete len:204 (-) Transcript_49849:620-1231(-)